MSQLRFHHHTECPLGRAAYQRLERKCRHRPRKGVIMRALFIRHRAKKIGARALIGADAAKRAALAGAIAAWYRRAAAGAKWPKWHRRRRQASIAYQPGVAARMKNNRGDKERRPYARRFAAACRPDLRPSTNIGMRAHARVHVACKQRKLKSNEARGLKYRRRHQNRRRESYHAKYNMKMPVSIA